MAYLSQTHLWYVEYFIYQHVEVVIQSFLYEVSACKHDASV